jgi:hypothetical protein
VPKRDELAEGLRLIPNRANQERFEKVSAFARPGLLNFPRDPVEY